MHLDVLLLLSSFSCQRKCLKISTLILCWVSLKVTPVLQRVGQFDWMVTGSTLFSHFPFLKHPKCMLTGAKLLNMKSSDFCV